MTSEDRALFIEIFDAKLGPVLYRLDSIEGRLERVEAVQEKQGQQITELQKDVSELQTEQKRQGEQISELQAGQKEIRAEIIHTREDVKELSGRVGVLESSIGWGLAIIGIFLGFITFAVTCFVFLRREKTEKPEHERAQNNSRLLRLEMLQILQEYGLIPDRRV